MIAATNTLQIRLLGHPELVCQDTPLYFRSRKVLALFIYLLVTQEYHPRDKLIALFWPESNQTRGRTSLRTTITRLRQSLKETAVTIQTVGDTIGFNANAAIRLDLNAIETGLLTGELSTTLLPNGAFLEGFYLPDAPVFDDWVGIQRIYWSQQVEKLYQRICRHQLDSGQRQQAIHTATQWLTVFPPQ